MSTIPPMQQFEPSPEAEELQEPSPETSPRHIPHLGHALLFLAIAGVLLLVLQALLFVGRHPAGRAGAIAAMANPKLLLGSMAAAYAATLGLSALIFPHLWGRNFLSGIGWNWAAARRQALRLIGLGLALGFTAAIASYSVETPKTLPIDQMFQSASDAWLITAFGVLLAPVFEEIAFRGFLVPAFAIAYDWFSLPRSPDAHTRWQRSTTLSVGSLMFSAILSSVFFALLHAQQVAHLAAALIVLFCVSLVLTYVRIRTQSVACSAMVHAAYNSFVFMAVLIQTGGYRHLDRLAR